MFSFLHIDRQEHKCTLLKKLSKEKAGFELYRSRYLSLAALFVVIIAALSLIKPLIAKTMITTFK